MEGIYKLRKCDAKKCGKEFVVLTFKNAEGSAGIWKRDSKCPDCGKPVSIIESSAVHIAIDEAHQKVEGKVVRKQLEVPEDAGLDTHVEEGL